MAECSKCGACCHPVMTHWPLDEIRYRAADLAEVLFLLKNWSPVTTEEAQRMNPVIGKYDLTDYGGNFYRCAQFDTGTKECMAHNDRPNVCSGFPWYGGAPRVGPLWQYPECSYRDDIQDADDQST